MDFGNVIPFTKNIYNVEGKKSIRLIQPVVTQLYIDKKDLIF